MFLKWSNSKVIQSFKSIKPIYRFESELAWVEENWDKKVIKFCFIIFWGILLILCWYQERSQTECDSWTTHQGRRCLPCSARNWPQETKAQIIFPLPGSKTTDWITKSWCDTTIAPAPHHRHTTIVSPKTTHFLTLNPNILSNWVIGAQL